MKFILKLFFLFLIEANILAVDKPENVSKEDIQEYIQKAIVEYNSSRYEASLEYLKRIIKSDLNNPQIRYLAAHSHWKLKNYAPASKHFQNFIQNQPSEIAGHVELGLLYLKWDRIRKSIETIKKGIKILGKDKVTSRMYNVLSRAYLRIKKPKNALKYAELSKAVENSSNAERFEALSLEARAHLMLGQYSKAEISSLWAISILPEDAYSLNLLGFIRYSWANDIKYPNEKRELIKNARKNFLQALEKLDKKSPLYKIVKKNLKKIL